MVRIAQSIRTMSETKQIPLGHNMFAIVDVADFERFKDRKWHLIKRTKPEGTDYAAGWPNPRGEVKCQDRLHRVIMGAKPGEDVRFRDGNGLNCSRANLQIVTHGELRRTARRSARNTSGVKGVSFYHEGQRRWRAYIAVDRKSINLGRYATFDEAVAARMAAEKKYHGEFSKPEPNGEGKPEQPRVLNVTWFPPADADVHHLSGIDERSQAAVCSICGPTKIKPSGRKGNWKCLTTVKRCRFKNRKAHNRKGDLLKRPYLRFKKDHCERCPFMPVHPCQLHVHHRDYDGKNNDPLNLETLCANCHALETQMKRDEIFRNTNASAWIGTRKRKANLQVA